MQIKKISALFFASLLLSESMYSSVIALFPSTMLTAAPPAIAETGDNMLDLYSGNFNYSVPLLVVPGPNGESVPVSANYYAGIRTDQKASWLGLGWDYNPGEITRQVIGVPDDYSGQPVFSGYTYSNSYEREFIFGPFHYKKIKTTTSPQTDFPYTIQNATSYITSRSCDRVIFENPIENYSAISSPINGNTPTGIPHRYFAKSTAPYTAPAYDKYHVSGPGISGKLRPYIFKDVYLTKTPTASGTIYYPETIEKAQFYMENSTDKTIFGADATNNTIKSGYFVKYYTNAEINQTGGSSILYNNTTQVGFLDYRIVSSGTRRSSNDFDTNGIGAIQVTDPSGVTYHYSLPVYSKNELSLSHIPGVNEITLTNTNFSNSSFTFKPYQYATSWKLTAVTGPDYQDANNNKIADEGDTGYWIAYNYSLWNNNHLWSTCFFNAKDEFSSTSRFNPSYNYRMLQLYEFKNAGYTLPKFQKFYNQMQGVSQIYYLDNIQTASHTAFFIKDIRFDEHSYDKVLNNAAKPNALLKLSKIVLLRNEDKHLIQNNAPWKLSSVNPKFNTAPFASATKLIHIEKYNALKKLIDDKSLKSIDFKSDYSLCKKYYSNINNTFTTYSKFASTNSFTSINSGSKIFFSYYNDNLSNYSTADEANSGKLTLNEIIAYEDGGVKVSPSYVFDYDKSNSAKNPDYSFYKTDLWGYYKSDYSGQGNSHYVTLASAANTDAWSLKQIITPTGSKIRITYESDEYEREGYANDPNLSCRYEQGGTNLNDPSLIYPINQMNLSDFDDIEFEYNDYSYVLNQNLSLGYSLNLLVVPFKYACNGGWDPPNAYNFTQLMAYYSGKIGIPSGGTGPLYAFNFEKNPSCSTVFSTGIELRPDLSSQCNSSSLSSPYDKSNYGYGYSLTRFKKLKGGGVRVKEIEFSDNVNSYKRVYTYKGGYCPIVPKSFMLGQQTEFTQFILWHNMKLLLPDGPGSDIGYSSVTVKNINKYNEDNGNIVYYFNNNTLSSPLKSIAAVTENNPVYPCEPSSCYSGGSIQPKKGRSLVYSIKTVYQNNEIKMLGRPDKTEYYADASNANTLVSLIEYKYSNTNFIQEVYGHNLSFEELSTKVFPCEYPQYTYIQTACPEKEKYNYSAISHQNYTPHLISISRKTDGIVTTQVLQPHPHSASIQIEYNTGSTIGSIQHITGYMHDSISALGYKADNIENKNQVILPFIDVTYKQPQIYNFNQYYTSYHKTIYNKTNLYRQWNNSDGFYESVSETKNWYHPAKNYKWLLDDNTPYTSSSPTPVLRKESEITLFNKKGAMLESKGLNNRESAIKYGYNYLYPLAQISNANYNSFTFTSYEDEVEVHPSVKHFGGEVTKAHFRAPEEYTAYEWVHVGGGLYSYFPVSGTLVKPHTGYYVAKVPVSTEGPGFHAKGFEIGRRYRAQVWVHKFSPVSSELVVSLSGVTTSSVAVNKIITVDKNDASNIQVGDWILMTAEMDVPVDLDLKSGSALSQQPTLSAWVQNSSNSVPAYFDDFSFHPIDAPIMGKVYEPRTGRIIAELDDENFAATYNYDAAGRIKSVFKETKTQGFVKTIEKEYHNSRP